MSGFRLSDVTPRVLPAILLFLNTALLLGSPAVHAQTAEPEARDGSISGTVYSQSDNQPATQVAVSIKSHEAGIYRSVLTDYEGHFEVSGLARGTYEIRVEESGYEPLQTTAQVDGSPAKVELHLIPSSPAPRSRYTISVRELRIPDKAHEEYARGLQSLDKKDFTSSLSHFTKAIQKFPGYFEAFYHQGVVHTSLGQLEKAMQAFQKCLELSGGRYARADFGIGYLLYLQGKAGEAEGVIRRGLEVDGNSADGYVVLGMTLLRLNRPDEAEKSAREALLRDPKLANAYLVLADSFARRQNYLEQIQGLDSYLKLEPTGQLSQRAHEARELAMKFLNRTQPQN
ncbi:MAG TPA: tetratricopeptide repeat protein [Candidatus Angelobacter sp.]|nr:tetratricopeptide repeat protein [Candidatus Angelobacter sp.]